MVRVSPFFVSLVLSQIAHGGVLITLNPSASAPGEGYAPGQVVRVDVLSILTPGTPSVQPALPTPQNNIRVRLFNLDLTDTSPGLVITPVLNYFVDDEESGDYGISFWNFDSTPNCANNRKVCGERYFIDDDLVSITPNILNITWTGLTSSASGMISLNQTTPKLVGSMDVNLPNAAGSFVLDVLNADEDDANLGAEIRHGLGVLADPADPASPLRANTSEITGGRLEFVVVPEPATLALLGLGGLAAAFRRRSA